VVFERTKEAAEMNSKILEDHGFDLARLFESESDTTLGFGSEFRPLDQLRKVLGGHPNFPFLEEYVSTGMPYLFRESLPENIRRAEVEGMIQRGNHKSALVDSEKISELIDKDVRYGFSLPVTIESVSKLKGSMVEPLGIVRQFTPNLDGSRRLKFRMTQDLSFFLDTLGTDRKLSINDRIDMGQYVEMIFGWCLPRIIHYILSLRLHHPQLRILIAKYDYTSAYRRMAHSAEAAAQTVSTHELIAFIALRLTFGGSPNPAAWTCFSEMVTDLANEISQCDEWDPTELRSPVQGDTPKPIRLPDSIPIARACAQAVEPPPTPEGRVDGFIDDLINVFLDTDRNCARQPHVVPLAVHVTSRPHAGDDEPIPRQELLSIAKLLAEGSPEEIQAVLGWILDTRRLLVSLPTDKTNAWLSDLEAVIRRRRCTIGDLETLVGRLNHAAFVIPLARHFIGRLWEVLESKDHKGAHVRIDQLTLMDLHLWETLLRRAHQGISMNLLTTRQPTRLCFSDSCPVGLGGWNTRGRAWRVRIPEECVLFGQQGINNLLEFLAMAVNVRLECEHPNWAADSDEFPCILALGDNTSALGWLHRSSHLSASDPFHEAHLQIARDVARVVLNSDACLASQHVKGKLNVVADLLSFAGTHRADKAHPIAFDDPDDAELTRRFHSLLHQQIPEDFEICPLPSDILSWISQILQTAASSWTPSRKGATKRGTGSGAVGKDSSPKPAFVVTPSSLLYPRTSKRLYSNLSFPATDLQSGPTQAEFLEHVRSRWSQALCAMPQAIWLRRFGSITNQAPFTSRTRPSCTPSCEACSLPSQT